MLSHSMGPYYAGAHLLAGRVIGTLAADRTGDHWQQGLPLGREPVFSRGETATIRTQDVAPIPLDLGVAIPAHYEGQSALAWRSDPAARSAPSGV